MATNVTQLQIAALSLIAVLAFWTSMVAPASVGALDIGLPRWAFQGICHIRRLRPKSKLLRASARLLRTLLLVNIRSLGILGNVPRVLLLARSCEKDLCDWIAMVSVVLLNKHICSLIIEPMLNAFQLDLAKARTPVERANARAKLVRDIVSNLVDALRAWTWRQIRY